MNRRNFLAVTALFAMAPVESILKAGTSEGVLTFEATILEFDKINSNKRIYPSSLLKHIPTKPIGMAVTNKMPEGAIVRFSDMIDEVESLYWHWFNAEVTLQAKVKFFKPQNVKGMTLRTFGQGKVDWGTGVGDDFKLNGVALVPEKIACTWN